jgi:hypothetical protein
MIAILRQKRTGGFPDIFIWIIIICVGIAHCSTESIIRRERIDSAFTMILRDVRRHSDYPLVLKERRIGLTGYFYLIDSNGRILYHPEEALIGLSFRDNPFIRKLLEKRSGCFEQLIEGQNRVILFRSVDAHRILCLSILSSEVDIAALNCEQFE